MSGKLKELAAYFIGWLVFGGVMDLLSLFVCKSTTKQLICGPFILAAIGTLYSIVHNKH